MARKKRNTEIFSLSFLDCMCCGFGALVLFYTVISAQSGVERVRKHEDLAAETNRLEEEVLEGYKNLVVLRNSVEQTTEQKLQASGRLMRLIEELERLCERRILRIDGLRFRFRYEMVRQVLLGSVSPARQRLLHERLAGHVEDAALDPPTGSRAA